MKLKLYPRISLLTGILLFGLLAVQGQGSIPGYNAKSSSRNIRKNTATTKEQDSPFWQASALGNIKRLEYAFYPTERNSAYKASNTATNTIFQISHDGYQVSNACRTPEEQAWTIGFQLAGIERSGRIWSPDCRYGIIQEDSVLRYTYSTADVEYVNSNEGLRQNFIIKERPSGNAPFLIHIQLSTALEPELVTTSKLSFKAPGDEQKVKLTYEDLKVWDAEHKPVPASMKLAGNELLIEVDDSKASYPITVDPINKTPDWNTSVDGVLANLLDNTQMKAAMYGYAVCGLGDVNGDGFGDVAVSAPTMIDLFSGNNTLASVGAVFIFYGSANGLSTIYNAVLQPNTAVAGALFGVSIDAGDINNDGVNEIVVGAPLDRYQVTLGGNGVNVTAGKVYIYKGGSLAATNPSPLLDIRLNSSFFTQGILNVLLSNTGVNALFGFSVAFTDDLNGDNKRDIIVGSPAYVGTSVGSVQSGSAFVFLSNAADSSYNTIRSLAPPTFSLLGINVPLISGINGLLFGYSVDGAGDYNGDGKADVVVGAPAGVNISSLTNILTGQMLGGSAYVYYGSGAGINTIGVNTSIGTSLQAGSGSLLGNTANLFGFKVKGVRNVSGNRNGNILVGAPLGGLVTGALNLTIHSGNVHLFKRKTSPPALNVADQVIESPKSTSLLQVLNTLDLNAMFGASMDNAYDVNGDGAPDLVVGEPLSSGTNILQLQASAAGGSAYVFFGDGNGGYLSIPGFDVSAAYGTDFASINGTALLGFSVAGARAIRGPNSQARIVVGSPSGALDFSGLLNLGNTVSTVMNFAAGNNGLGKAYTFDATLATLPVTLTELRAKKMDKTIEVTWKVEQESNINIYELQRSVDGVHYETIGMVMPWDNNATSNQYSFIDQHPAKGINYYRLKIVDKDSKYKITYVVAAKLTEKYSDKILIAPNPVVDRIRIYFSGIEKGAYRVEVRNTIGQLQQTRIVKINQDEQVEFLERSVSTTTGVYWVTIYDSKNQQIGISRVIIQ